MIKVSREQFEKMVSKAIDSLPAPFAEKINNVAFIVEDDVDLETRTYMKLPPNRTLFGLYQGVPLSARGGQLKTLPDKITIYKNPIEFFSNNETELYERINHTVWHEVAHYFGLDHERIDQLEKSRMLKLKNIRNI